jgi:hypothetical protein
LLGDFFKVVDITHSGRPPSPSAEKNALILAAASRPSIAATMG